METPNTGLRIKRILVPTDFSDASRQALPFAVAWAEQFGADITLLHVVPTALPADISHIGLVLQEKELQAAAENHLAQFRQAAIRSSVPVETVVRTGGPYHQIGEAAKEREVDLIIISTHGHTGLKHAFLGSTAERVVRYAPCPVLTVRVWPGGDSVPQSHSPRVKQILVPVDFSEGSHKALAYATAFAREFSAKITLLYVLEPPPYPRFGYAHVPMKEHELTRTAQEKLDALRVARDSDGAMIKAALVRIGSASQEIAQAAQELGSDLIIQATRGYSALENMLLGSTTEKVVRHAPCPVLAVRERGREFIPIPS